MSTRMLIDARHPEETRVAVVRNNRVEEYDYESVTKRQIKGNIYLAKVTRVEPSLQAAFVDFGGNRHGFLPFSEIHPDYYQIPVEDREALLKEEEEEARADAQSEEAEGDALAERAGEGGEEEVVSVGGDDEEERRPRRSLRPGTLRRRYRIQEVIRRRQILLVQVAKEERGSKGAALTTYLSLPGRYCVLMPNSPRGGGISRKISNPKDRRQLKKILNTLEVPEGMGVIIRTAGLNRTKSEIKRDFEYLLRLWDEIREKTLNSLAPALIYEEGDLIKRAIRDLYTRDIEEVLVEGEEGYRTAREFMSLLMPSHARRVKHYKEPIPLFQRYQVEQQLEAIHSPVVQLKSGGYLVFNPTEALVAIDVNSGRATREHHIEETALQTNLEAAEEIARQLRLRDLAGLIVIDFIDMENRQNIRAVERRLREALRSDRARIQLGRISSFGLLEMSRQRLRPNLVEASMITCPRCAGAGVVRSVQSGALTVLRAIEQEGVRDRSEAVRVRAPADVTHYLLNEKRAALADLERQYGLKITIEASDVLGAEPYQLERTPRSTPAEPSEDRPATQEGAARAMADEEAAEASGRTGPRDAGAKAEATERAGREGAERRSRRRRGGRGRAAARRQDGAAAEAAAGTASGAPADAAAEAAREPAAGPSPEDEAATGAAQPAGADGPAVAEAAGAEEEASEKRRSRRRGRRRARAGRAEDRAREEAAAVTEPAESAQDAAARPARADDATAAAGAGDAKEVKEESPAASTEAAGEAASRSFRGATEETAAAQTPEGEAPADMNPPARPASEDEAAPAKAAAKRSRTTRRRRSTKKQAVADEAEDAALAPAPAQPAPPDAAAADADAGGAEEERAAVAAATAAETGVEAHVEAAASGKPAETSGGEAEGVAESRRRRRGWWQKALGI
ncbi:MAG: hypothetical protein KatS3mg119_1349 [Rhodothalassiaceae bacterium]|nr:MAG: hypothetical protein KatS3mg119_1349 [Rhodothalassiaceae bacterium]